MFMRRAFIETQTVLSPGLEPKKTQQQDSTSITRQDYFMGLCRLYRINRIIVVTTKLIIILDLDSGHEGIFFFLEKQ